MLKGFIGKVVGDSNEREVRKLQPMVEAINALEPEMEQRTDAELRALTVQFRARLAAGDTLDDLLIEAFAGVREVAKRTVDMRPFDVQLVGGIVLHQGKVAEMKTGEGKTLVATMPVYLNALAGRGVHLVTVNDYLARRDALWMGAIYHLMGLSVGLLQSGAEQPAYLYDPAYQRDPYPGLRPVPRREAYRADVTYGTNNEFGFDYLRDNLAYSIERRVQQPLFYAIVDEVDNIFIDEARTPLIISGPSGESVEDYSRFAAIARKLQSDVHYELDEKERSVYLTDEGLAVIEEETGIENIYDEANYRYVHYMQQALKAQVLFLEGRDYIRQRKQIILIDQHTGRLMPSRRLSEGLHQAIEAKESVTIRPRDVTSATITIQNYFRMYEKLAGMSGTAVTEGEEFFKIYNLDVVAIPTNKPVVRTDHPDVVYRSEEAKLRAVARELLTRHSRGQPVLVGTTSVEMSERLSKRLTGERLQMAAMASRLAYALQEMDLDREDRDSLYETMDTSLETMNPAAWRRVVRALDLEPNALSADNQTWLIDYLGLPADPGVRRALEQALRDGIPHQILNAKEHTREASIIARAGEPGAVTIATNMAGRGVDIKLGGDLPDEVLHRAHQALQARGLDPFRSTSAQMDSAIAEVAPQYAKRRDQVLGVGGLYILGTERHEARRIDNQLRGRSGRQGEPGASRFYLSLEDDLMRRFGRREMLAKLMGQIGDDFPIEHNLVSRTLERAQTSVEGYNFDIRKHLLEYDDVLNRQRETIYDERLRILKSDDLRAEVWRMLEQQVDEYLERIEEPDQQRLVFTGLDDVIPLILPAPSASFQGPVAFGSHLTAFPPFTISFLADQLAGQPLPEVEQSLRDLSRQAAASYGEYLGQIVGEITNTILEKYEERLDRFRALIDEKIEDYLQLAEERGQVPDVRRLAQHLERTYPLKLTTPRTSYQLDLDDLRDHWLAEVEVQFHRQTCNTLLERVQIRLPADIRLDKLRPGRVPPQRLADEMRRVLALATKQPQGEGSLRRLEQLTPPTDDGATPVLEFVTAIKELSELDFGRLDRLMGHVLGAYLDDLLGQYLEAVDEEQGGLERKLERLRDSVIEGKKGRRAGNLAGVLRELNGLVHLEIPILEDLLGQVVAHEYDKWAQRQLLDIASDASRNPLSDTTWTAVAEHLLATHYSQRQAYDRDHRRRASWLPRLPFNFLGQALVTGMDVDAVRDAVLASLLWAIEQREQVWGQEEVRRWGSMSLDELDPELYDGLLTYLGEQKLGDLTEQLVDDLPRNLYDRLRFILALHRWEKQNERLGDLPQADALLSQLGEELEDRLLDSPLGELDDSLQESISEQLSQAGLLDDPAARTSLINQPVRNWDARTRDEVASFWGRQFIELHQLEPLAELEPEPRNTAIAYLKSQRRFVNEEQVQHFLIHQRLADLPPETQQAAIMHVAHTRLGRLSKRKISNLDINTRQSVVDSLQRIGIFTDESRRDELQARPLTELEPKARAGFGVYLARHYTDNRRLRDLEASVRESVIERLTQNDALFDPDRVNGLATRRLSELDEAVANQILDDLVTQLRTDLATKTMEELPVETRNRVHQALDQKNYFVDQEKVGWYERRTLAQLPSDLLRGLEQHLGKIRVAEFASTPFRELPPEIRESLLAFLENAELLPDRAAHLRLTQTGKLGDLADDSLQPIAQHLGRQWLVRLRDQRPPALPEQDREAVWVYLRGQGYFADEFKEELFAYQKLDEFDAETCQAVEATLTGRLRSELETQQVGGLPSELRAQIRDRLSQADYFVDESRLRQIKNSPPQSLPEGLRQALEAALGAHLLADLDAMPVADLPPEIQAALWRYLDEIGYFVDEKKRNQVMDHRLADLKSSAYEQVVADLAQVLENEIVSKPVSELNDDLRQGLREALETLDYFESAEVQAQVMAQPLGSLQREDLDGLALQFGRLRLEDWTDRTLNELVEADKVSVLAHLQANNWFLDRTRLDGLKARPLGELEASTAQSVLKVVRRQHTEHLSRKRMADLDRAQQRLVHQILLKQGLALDESQMRPFRRQRLVDLEPDVYRYLLRDLGEEVVSEWSAIQFRNLEPARQAPLSAYLGRRILGRIERRVLLYTISRLWIDYLTDIEDLRRGIGLEAYGQRDPLIEYKRRAFELFEELGENIRRSVAHSLFRQSPEPLTTQ